MLTHIERQLSDPPFVLAAAAVVVKVCPVLNASWMVVAYHPEIAGGAVMAPIARVHRLVTRKMWCQAVISHPKKHASCGIPQDYTCGTYTCTN